MPNTTAFDRIYCIYSEQSHNRRANAEREFRRLGIDTEVCYLSADLLDQENDCVSVNTHPRQAASLAHAELVRRAAADGCETLLIFESDVHFLSSDPTNLHAALKELAGLDWQLFFLGMNLLSDQLHRVHENLIRTDPATPAPLRSTHAYAIHRRAFETILTYPLISEPRPAIDSWLAANLPCHCLVPLFSVQRQGWKPLRFRRNYRRAIGRRSWLLELAGLVCEHAAHLRKRFDPDTSTILPPAAQEKK